MILKCNGISEISYDEWINIRLNNFEKYPVQPLDKHLRLDIELSYPRKSLYDIPAGWLARWNSMGTPISGLSAFR